MQDLRHTSLRSSSPLCGLKKKKSIRERRVSFFCPVWDRPVIRLPVNAFRLLMLPSGVAIFYQKYGDFTFPGIFVDFYPISNHRPLYLLLLC